MAAQFNLVQLAGDMNNHFIGINNNGRGECLFYTLGMLLENNDTFAKAMEIRNNIYDYQYKSQEDNIFPLNAQQIEFMRMGTEAEEQKSAKLMNQQGVYGTEYEIFKAAKLYNRPIVVYQDKPTHNYRQQCIFNNMNIFDRIRSGQIFRGVRRYLTPPIDNVMSYLVCIYLPNNNTNTIPLLIYNMGNNHFIMLRHIEDGIPNFQQAMPVLKKSTSDELASTLGITKDELKKQEQLLSGFEKLKISNLAKLNQPVVQQVKQPVSQLANLALLNVKENKQLSSLEIQQQKLLDEFKAKKIGISYEQYKQLEKLGIPEKNMYETIKQEEKSLEPYYVKQIDPVIARFWNEGHNPTDSHYNQLKEMIKKGLDISNVKFTDLKK